MTNAASFCVVEALSKLGALELEAMRVTNDPDKIAGLRVIVRQVRQSLERALKLTPLEVVQEAEAQLRR